jgi:hypothetical protein
MQIKKKLNESTSATYTYNNICHYIQGSFVNGENPKMLVWSAIENQYYSYTYC